MIGELILCWLTPQRTLKRLSEAPGENSVQWEDFRDTKCRKWVTLNIICGLIMGAITTLLFSNYPLSTGAFTLGAFSLLSGLIATSLGTGLIYVLCSLKGIQYQALVSRSPVLFALTLVLPQAWAMACFSSFYLACAVALWEANNKAWVVKLGVILSTVCLILHLAGFIFVFRREPAEAYDDLPPGN